jgi:putative membrane protein
MATLTNLRLACTMAFAFTLAFVTSSCKNEPKQDDSMEVAEDMNKPQDDATKEMDEKFLMDAAEINLEEIQLGQLAQQKGVSQEVKDLGKMLAESHTKALNELTSLASSKSIAVPTTPTEAVQNTFQNMSEKTGDEFDKAYCNKMVQGHKDAIDKFEKAAEESKDADIRNWASNKLPELRDHLNHAQACEDKLKNM